jgi:hypothetical protein
MKYLLFLLLAIVMPFAYAEEATVDVPFDYNTHGCFLESTDLYVCKFTVVTEPMEKPEIVDVPTNSTDPILPLDDLQEESKGELEKWLEKQKPFIDQLRKQQDKGKTTPTEDDYLDLVDNIKLCARGYNESAPVQTHGVYAISSLLHDIDLSVDFQDHPKYRDLVKKGLECKYQTEILHPTVLGVRYLHMSYEMQRHEIGHHSEVAAGLETHPSDVKGSESSEAIKAHHKGVCENDMYTIQTKLSMGCNIEYEEKPGIKRPQKTDYTYYTPQINYREYMSADGQVDGTILQEYRNRNADDVNVTDIASRLGIDPVELEKFLESQR